MATTKYQKFCIRLWGKRATKVLEKVPQLRHDIIKARIRTRPDVYISVLIMNAVYAFWIGIAIFVYMLILYPKFVPLPILAISATLPVVLFGITYSSQLGLPAAKAYRRGKLIDLKLPQTTTYMAILASAGIEVHQIIRTLAKREIYGEVQKECLEIVKYMDFLGLDFISALRRAISNSPSARFQELLQGIITTITSGGDLRGYLKSKSEYYRYTEKMDAAERIDLFSTLGETYVTLCIVAPLLFIIMFMVMGMATGSPIAIYGSLIIATVMIPVVNVVYIAIIRSFETEKVEYVRNVKKELGIVAFSVVAFGILMYIGVISGSIDFMVFGLVALIAPYGFYMGYKIKEINQIEDRFPDFLRDVGEDRRVGTTLMQSIRNASKRNYGRLTPLVKRASVLLTWNITFKDILRDFAKKYPSSQMKECVDLIEQGTESGGSVAEIIIDTAEHAKTRRVLELERRRKLKTYLGITYISFIVFLIIVALVSALMVPMMGKIAEMGEIIPGMGGGSEKSSAESIKLFYHNTLFLSSIVLAIGSGVVCGVLADKNVFVGLRHAVVMVIIAYVVFRIAIF